MTDQQSPGDYGTRPQWHEPCTTGDCDGLSEFLCWVDDCDCMGDENTYPNCWGHPYCPDCAHTFETLAGCLRCSSPGTMRSHDPDCDKDPARPNNVIVAHFKAKNPEYVGIVWEAIANGAVRALTDAGFRIESGPTDG